MKTILHFMVLCFTFLLAGNKYFFWTSTRGFGDKPLEKRLDYQELTNRLRSPGNGLGDIYQIDMDVLSIGK